MRKFVVAAAVAATMAFAGIVGWQASAAPPAASVPHAGPYTPIQPAACGGGPGACPPGRHRVCGPAGRECWCAPC